MIRNIVLLAALAGATYGAYTETYQLAIQFHAPPPSGALGRWAIPPECPDGATMLAYQDSTGAYIAVPAARYTIPSADASADILTWPWDEIPEACRNMLHVVINSQAPIDAATDPSLNTDYNRFLVRVKNPETDAFILKEYPSYVTLLHDTGFNIQGRKEYVYGWWCAADIPVDGTLRRMATPDFEADPTYGMESAFNNGQAQLVSLVARSVERPEAKIRTAYEFWKGFPGVRVTREYFASGEKPYPWGGEGYWLGGSSSSFPTHNTEPPSACYYGGAWREKGPWPVMKTHYGLVYWDKDGFWLAAILDPATLKGPFHDPSFRVDGQHPMSPAWVETVEPFKHGTLAAYYIAGRSCRETAATQVEAFYQYLAAPPTIAASLYEERIEITSKKLAGTETPQPSVPSSIPAVSLENQGLRLDYDPATAAITSLHWDAAAQRQFGEDLLDGPQRRIYFTGGSQWPRSLDWEDTDDRYLAADPSEAEIERPSDTRMEVRHVLLRDPETQEAFFDCNWTIELAAPDTLRLTSVYTALQPCRPPYLGWHFDFPEDTFRWFRRDDWDHDATRWDGYRMGFMDLQPMRPALTDYDILAFPAQDSGKHFALDFHFLPETNTDSKAVNQPNRLFDHPQGIQKVGMTATRTFWEHHNTIGDELKPGETKTLAAEVRFLKAADVPPPASGFIRIRLPHAPEQERVLQHFWMQHCFSGPQVFGYNITAWWQSLISRFNGKVKWADTREHFKTKLESYSNGEQDNGFGWKVPYGGLSSTPGRFGWNGGYIFETNAQIILAAEQYYLVTGDRPFIEEQIKNMERAIQFYLTMCDNSGVIVLPEKYNGIDQNCSSSYWDGWQIGHKSAFIQMYAAGAAEALSRIERAMDRKEQVDNYAAQAETLKQALLETYWREGDLQDNQGAPIPGGRLISWIAQDGAVVDAGFTDINLMAIALNLLPKEHTQKVYEWINHDPHAYAWRDHISSEETGIITFNTLDGNSTRVYRDGKGPKRYYAGPFNPFCIPPGMENGQIQYWVAGYDLYNRAHSAEPESAWKKLGQFLARYGRGDLDVGHGVPESRPLPMFQGTSQMSPLDLPCGSDQSLSEDGLIYGLGVLSGIFGVQCDYRGLYLEPHIPLEYAGATIENLHYQGRHFTLRFHGSGSSIQRIAVNGQPGDTAPYVFPFQESMRPGDEEAVVHVYMNE